MSRIVAFCFLFIAAVVADVRMDAQPAWSTFKPPFGAIAPLDSEEIPGAVKGDSFKSHAVGVPQDDWLPDTGALSVHASSLIALNDGNIRAFWFAGTREGAADVVIVSAVFDSKSRLWGAPTTVIDRVGAERGLSRYIAKLGNPVPARMADGRLQLFFVTVSMGGWAGSSISTMISDDEGVTWSKPERLITSPLMNISTLVKSPSVQFADGRLGLPAYHEWIGRFGEFLRIEGSQVIDLRRMSAGRGTIQPVVLLQSNESASAYFRQTRGAQQLKQIPVSQTTDAGQSWQSAPDLDIANPNSAVSMVTLNDGVQLMAANNIETGRYRLVLMMNDGHGGRWHPIQILEDDESLPNDQRREFSYPYLISTNGSDAHLVYTWNRKRIRHIYFDGAWIEQAKIQLTTPVTKSLEQGVQ